MKEDVNKTGNERSKAALSNRSSNKYFSRILLTGVLCEMINFSLCFVFPGTVVRLFFTHSSSRLNTDWVHQCWADSPLWRPQFLTRAAQWEQVGTRPPLCEGSPKQRSLPVNARELLVSRFSVTRHSWQQTASSRAAKPMKTTTLIRPELPFSAVEFWEEMRKLNWQQSYGNQSHSQEFLIFSFLQFSFIFSYWLKV